VNIVTAGMPRYYAFVIFLMTVIFFSAYASNAAKLGIGIPQGWLWILAFAGLSLPLIISLIRPDQRLSTAPILNWAYAFMAITMIWHFVSTSPTTSIEMIFTYLWYVLTLVLAFVVLRTVEARRVALRAVQWIVLVSVAVNIYQSATGTWRPSGLYGNPNTSGYALVMGMILTYRIVPSRFRFPYQLIVLSGIFVTGSRGSLLLWGISAILLYVLNDERQNQTRWAATSMVAVFLFVVSPLGEGIMDSLNKPDGPVDRFLSLGSKEQLEGDSRVALLELGIEKYKAHPFLGYGTGENTLWTGNRDWGTHNMFLALMLQFGLIGFFIMPALVMILIGRDRQRWCFTVPIGVVVLIACMFDNNLLDQWHYAFAFALVTQMRGNEFPEHSRQAQPRAYGRPASPLLA
jgi:hypothetical protein